MDNSTLAAFKGFERALNQMRTRLGEPHDEHIIGNEILLDQLTIEVELILAGRREPDLNMFKAQIAEHLEIFEFLIRIHRIGQRLIAVAHVHRAPLR